MNPYAELDVPPEADAAAIRRAYRRRAKATHPDHGGDPAAFQRAKHASVVLLDPARRAKFDQTGVIDEPAADNALAEVLVACSQLLDAVMIQCDQNGEDPTGVDVIARMGSLAQKSRTGIDEQRRQVEKHLRLSLRLEGRFKIKHKDGGGNRMAALVQNRIAAQRQTLAVLEAEKGKIDRVVAFLKDYGFEVDASARRSPNAGFRISAFGGWG